MAFEIDARFDNRHPFAFEEFFLKRSVGFADEDSPAFAHDSVPRNALPGWTGRHCASSGARATAQAQGSSQRPIG